MGRNTISFCIQGRSSHFYIEFGYRPAQPQWLSVACIEIGLLVKHLKSDKAPDYVYRKTEFLFNVSYLSIDQNDVFSYNITTFHLISGEKIHQDLARNTSISLYFYFTLVAIFYFSSLFYPSQYKNCHYCLSVCILKLAQMVNQCI